jgi:ribonucleoside-diphosphate reductase alpha chain
VVALRATTTGGIILTVDNLEALTDAPPKQAKQSATAAEAAAWLEDPTAVQTKPLAQLVLQLETDAPICRNCGNITQRSGSCHTCPCCGTSNGCA